MTKNGPYVVTGCIPLAEKIIVPKGKCYEFQSGRTLPQNSCYALCRCGHTGDAPFCDGSHDDVEFDGTETASRDCYEDRAEVIEGPTLNLKDDHRCANSRFCHREPGDAWEMTECAQDDTLRNETIRAAIDCPSGRLTAVEKDGTIHEPVFEQEVEILQDSGEKTSAGIFVKGGIPIRSADGYTFEVRNRAVLCRCGESRNKPFCDGAHTEIKYMDQKKCPKNETI